MEELEEEGGYIILNPSVQFFPLLNQAPPIPSSPLPIHLKKRFAMYLYFSMDLTIVSKQVSPVPMTQYPPALYPPTQYPPTQYPTTQYPPTQNPTTQYPPTQYPTTQQYPSTQYPTTQEYPTASGADAQAHVQAPQKVKSKKRNWDWCYLCRECSGCCSYWLRRMEEVPGWIIIISIGEKFGRHWGGLSGGWVVAEVNGWF